MKLGVLALFFVLAASVNAAWEQYQYDSFNAGKAPGTGYFGSATITTITNSFDGMNFQPIVSDIDSDGKNEVIIFSHGFLKVFDSNLLLIEEAFVGKLQGQPTAYNIDNDQQKEIIFISNINSSNYFFAYEYALGFRQEFNFTLENGAIGSGIKCTELRNSDICIFMDNKQYVHIVNMSSGRDESYNTSAYDDTLEKIPAIGDLHDDGSLEAVFWLNKNNDDNYDLIAFDLVNKSLDANFNEFGHVDNVYSASHLLNQVLKGHPVLVDLNNDNKMEIAVSVFYDDEYTSEMRADWFTEIFVYGHNGSQLFRECEEEADSSPGNCNDGSSIVSMREGTNPFVLDSNDDGIDDICFTKDKKAPGNDNMTINCYNYSGSLLLNAMLHPEILTVKTAITSDMNNDGLMEIITGSNIYALNGKSIYSYNFSFNFAVPADLDGNGGLDLIWSKENQTIVFLDNTSYFFDLSIEGKDILFEKNNTQIVVHNNGNGFIDNFEVLALNTDTMENETAVIGIRGNSNISINFNLTLNYGETLLIQLDYNNKIDEIEEKNNFAFKRFENFPFVYASIDLDIGSLEGEFADYIQDNLKSGYFTADENSADIKIYIGKNNLINRQKMPFTKNNFGYYYDFGNIYYKDKIGSFPYNALISSYKDDNGIINILVYGNEIDGTIAAAKEFINKEADFFNINEEYSYFVDDENLIAIRIFDFLHNAGNEGNYLADNDAFRNIVRNALRDGMFTETDYSVASASGVNLRLRNLKPNSSDIYLSYLTSTGMPIQLPVVLAHGLFSNLSTWQTLASEISNTGRDTWLIEITGGPGQDCEDCVDYTFDDLTDDFVPALLNGVLDFTGKDNIQYVGFSNGCRAALDSLERGKFDSNKVETFVAVGCPGAFDELSLVDSGILLVDDKVVENLQNKNVRHVDINALLKSGLLNKNAIIKGESEKISLNLWKNYLFFMSSSNDTQPGKITISKFGIIQGNALGKSDGIVPTIDEDSIYSNIKLRSSSNNNIDPIKQSFKVLAFHSNLDTIQKSKTLIRKLLNNEELSFFENTFNLINQSSVIG